jgi:hypothetical protein
MLLVLSLNAENLLASCRGFLLNIVQVPYQSLAGSRRTVTFVNWFTTLTQLLPDKALARLPPFKSVSDRSLLHWRLYSRELLSSLWACRLSLFFLLHFISLFTSLSCLTSLDSEISLLRPQHASVTNYKLRLISGYRSNVHEICPLLGYDSALNGSSLPKFQDNLSAHLLGSRDLLTLEMEPIGCPETSV